MLLSERVSTACLVRLHREFLDLHAHLVLLEGKFLVHSAELAEFTWDILESINIVLVIGTLVSSLEIRLV